MKTKFTFLLAGILTLLFSCTKDFIETDIKDKTVTLISPSDNYQSPSATVTFWWKELEGAAKYNLQVVTPDFSNVQRLVLDTNVTGVKFTYTLSPGSYQWRVKATNNGSSTQYTMRSLAIDSVPDLSAESVVLVSPTNGFVTNQTTNTFRWNALSSADDYRFQILNSSSTEIVDIILMADSFSYTLNAGTYTWQVRAQNSTSNTLYSSRSITVDAAAPSVSVIDAPANGDTLFNPVLIQWTRNISATGDSLFIYPDSLVLAVVYKGYTTNESYSFSGTVGQDYFFRLKSGDAAGNWSGYSALRKFWIK